MTQVSDLENRQAYITQQSGFIRQLQEGMHTTIIGQEHLVESLLIGLLADGHILLEGVPGLAKTLAITTLAKLIDADYSRIQFTPDLLPADLIGTLIYSQRSESFRSRRVLSSLTLSSLMRSTVLQPRCRVRSSRRCRSDR